MMTFLAFLCALVGPTVALLLVLAVAWCAIVLLGWWLAKVTARAQRQGAGEGE